MSRPAVMCPVGVLGTLEIWDAAVQAQSASASIAAREIVFRDRIIPGKVRKIAQMIVSVRRERRDCEVWYSIFANGVS
jgi:hypothetical protein